VYDRFHIIAQYCQQVIDRVRVDEMNRVGPRAAARRPRPEAAGRRAPRVLGPAVAADCAPARI
jgi:transposase